MSKIKVNPTKVESTIQLIEQLALALQSHHLGRTTLEPFARTYERDRVLLSRVEDFLTSTQEATNERVI